MKHYYSIIALLILCHCVRAQDLPTDYLSPDFHKERRQALRDLMPENSVAVFFANPERNRANDVDYIYHQDPDFYYLTGYKEPNSALLIFSDWQEDEDGNPFNELIFAQKKNEQMEMWTGKRLGSAGVIAQLGFENAYTNDEFVASNFDFVNYDKVMFFGFQNDVRNKRGQSDLYDMIASFRSNAEIPDSFNPKVQKLYATMRDEEKSLKTRKGSIHMQTRMSPALLDDPIVAAFLEVDDLEAAAGIINQIPKNNLDVVSLAEYMNQLREVKSKEEMKLLAKAIEVSCVGQIEVMKAMHPNMSETEIQGIHEFVFKKYGSEYEGYPSIVGAGNNGCILHYTDNNKPQVGNDLILMDIGAEYHGYTADVTRTIPADGTFSDEERAIYELVYQAQSAGFEECVVGNGFGAPDQAAREIIDEGLASLGIIEAGARHYYFPHGTSHYLGLDVHDRGTYAPFKAGTVITVEPGIYIPDSSDCDEKWWGIAVRIEDDILITEDGWINLSAMAPRSVEEIEAMMALPSPLDDFVLPDLDENH
jgi:Xaa-Pro aminopeptidase